MRKKKVTCFCGNIIAHDEICKCKAKGHRNKYQNEYYHKNKEILSPLNTSRWKKLRLVIIKRDKGHCQRCSIKYGVINGANLQVHHIKPRIDYPELIWEESNLITVCKTCNLQLGISGILDFKPSIELKDYDFDFKL